MTQDEKTEVMETADLLFDKRVHTRFCTREVCSHGDGAEQSGGAEYKAHAHGPWVRVDDPDAKPMTLGQILRLGEKIATREAAAAYKFTDRAEKRSADILAAAAEMRKQDEAMKEREQDGYPVNQGAKPCQ